jgi:hypothetical protein
MRDDSGRTRTKTTASDVAVDRNSTAQRDLGFKFAEKDVRGGKQAERPIDPREFIRRIGRK